MAKPSRLAKRTSLRTRRGSSIKVWNGSKGVRMSWSRISARPPVKSSTCSVCKLKNRALTVASRRKASSSAVPKSTVGFRLSSAYVSVRRLTKSRSSPKTFTGPEHDMSLPVLSSDASLCEWVLSPLNSSTLRVPAAN
ncbi:hypothetical protein HYQ46_003391 [Verticillium longisporum]|nr:hypothetical protein HYQ46_003391 [Verticillium longisporum]